MVAKTRFRTLIDVHVLPAGSARLILIRVKHAFSKSYLSLEVTLASMLEIEAMEMNN